MLLLSVAIANSSLTAVGSKQRKDVGTWPRHPCDVADDGWQYMLKPSMEMSFQLHCAELPFDCNATPRVKRHFKPHRTPRTVHARTRARA